MPKEVYGDDFNPGDIYTTARITLTETHVVQWAGLTMDFYPLHMDKVYAEQTQFGQRLVHGPLIFAMAVGLVGSAGFAGNSAIAWLGVNNMRMLKPVFIGDSITVVVEVIEKRETKSPDKGVQTWRYTVKNQNGQDVMVFDYNMMFHMRT
ncbi:MAG: MaoC family dehydratase N-terminal domain-containing protein [Proteobacteria bacterium]|nr:MaoC family dehydratase N-terminal domain-containing protein [Pseudomonadota bacterium]MBU1450704.1 MaoC family dehydratase N-terminal domain-containing protein [Pseudomonadota bacterium]MBU2468643.1 MaoC family dehydratase N-terminal domain-containing protein [Pseudomonadota bacterium]MBU2517679.1 MaoC family dehydratase N-terminal domain-containing protein [Pseudomonadota bacterium]